MPKLKLTVLAAAATGVLLCVPAMPAAAAGPLLFAPWAVGHLIGAAARLAALPAIMASAAISAQQPPGSYGAAPAYGAAPGGYYAPPAYYQRSQGYYPAAAYGRAAPYYARPMPRSYEPARGYYAPGIRYSGSYGAHVSYQSRGFGYRRR
jgi:hypothetical protein